ncbi:MAG TPA: hypothetical protein G4N96_02495 [Chloroflexi bacterium]|nr:hypothetical protein [Chloroflexota bacterium]
MSKFVASAIQQRVKVYDTPLDYQKDIFRFLQMARAKGANLVVLPALSPLMLVPPLASNAKFNLLKQSEAGKERLSGLVGKLMRRAATAASQAMGGLKGDLIQVLEHFPGEIYDAYIDLFSAAALKYKVTLVAGSFYLREDEEAECTHQAYIFNPNGMILGRQAKVHLSPEELSFCHPGLGFKPIETPVGRIGVLIGEDALYPESARILAYQGADILVNLSVTAGQPAWRQMRNAFLARVDENEAPGIQSALIGSNLLNPKAPDLVGKSALLQPFQLSDNSDGLIAQTANLNKEGIVAEAVSLEQFKDYWVRPAPRLRQNMQMAAYAPLSKVYANQKTLDKTYWALPGEASKKLAGKAAAAPRLEETKKPATPSPGKLLSPFAEDAD